jgi:hypothetical protein
LPIATIIFAGRRQVNRSIPFDDIEGGRSDTKIWPTPVLGPPFLKRDCNRLVFSLARVRGCAQARTLRDLERLALLDLGATWMSGRLQPDHSTIGIFIQLHQQVLSEQFFTSLVKHLVSKLHLNTGTVAMDGTVIAAAASHYRVLRAEALREGELSEQAARMLAERQAQRELRGRDGEETRLAPGQPEAVVQPTKDGPFRPSYKPSALRHERGLMIAQAVHPSSETAVVAGLLKQHREVFAAEPPRLLADAGYHSNCSTTSPPAISMR